METMEMPELKEGMLLKDIESGNKYRIYKVGNALTDLVRVLPTVLSFVTIENRTLLEYLFDKSWISVDEIETVIDERQLSAAEQQKFCKRKALINEIEEALDGNWTLMASKKQKPEIKIIQEKYGIPMRNIRRWVIRYVTSGQQVSSLADKTWFPGKKEKPYQYTVKPGRKSILKQGKILTDYDYEAFDYGIKLYKNGTKGKRFTIRKSFYQVLYAYYNEATITGHGNATKIVPADQRPTEDQYRTYLNKQLSAKDKAIAKQGLRDVRNNRRLLNSDTVIHAGGPLGICEADAWDVGCLLVSDSNPNIVVGKPTVYAIIDDYSKSIVTVFTSFDRDSYIGLSGTMLSLVQDKKELYAKHGLEINDLWFPPAGYMPVRFRTDRGSDFTSDAFEDLCNRIGVIREEVTGGTGSLKGNIERLWGRIGELMTASLDKKGLIRHEPNEKPWKDAKFTIDEFTTMVLIAAAGLNVQPCINYPMDADMIANDVTPTPKNLWEYGVKKYGLKKKINSVHQFVYDMMIDCKAAISRKGICFQGLYYKTDPENPDPSIESLRFEAGNRNVSFPIRIDPRRVDEIYYCNDGEITIRKAVLTVGDRAGMESYKSMTWQEYEAFKKKRDTLKAISRQEAETMKAAVYQTEEAFANQISKNHDTTVQSSLPMDPETGEIMETSKKQIGTRKDNLRIHHDEAKQKFRNEHSLYKEAGLNSDVQDSQDDSSLQQDKENSDKKGEFESIKMPETPEEWIALMKASERGEL